jgi:hypothetical protein
MIDNNSKKRNNTFFRHRYLLSRAQVNAAFYQVLRKNQIHNSSFEETVMGYITFARP